MQFKLMYPGFKSKALTLSYDDGVIQDVKLIEILNKYSLKATFNLNSGLQGEQKFRDGKYLSNIDCHRIIFKDYPNLYDNFEIATHTFSHPFLETLTFSQQEKEIKDDINNLEKIFNKKVSGMAYPYGTYNKDTLNVLTKLDVKYSRTTKSTYKFNRPYNFLLWHPTIHHRDPKLFETLDEFLKSEEELALFYLWGHAYEFSLDDNFSLMEEFGKIVNQNDDIYKATNIEIYDYIKASEMVYYKKREKGYFVNPSSKEIYLITEKGKKLVLHPLERLEYYE